MHYILCKDKNWVSALTEEIKRDLSTDPEVLKGFPLLTINSSIDLKNKFLGFSTTALINSIPIKEESVGKQALEIMDLVKSKINGKAKINCHVFALTEKYGILDSGRADILKTKLISHFKKNEIFSLRKDFDRSLAFLQVMILPDRSVVASFLDENEIKDYHSLISPFVGGFNNVEDDKKAPSRAYRKIVEAQIILGKSFLENQTVVDLGACPGGWTYIARKNGAKVIALDRSPLDESLMNDPKVSFLKTDAFKYRPEEKIDWAISDIICAPERILELIDFWVLEKACENFVFTIKFQGDKDYHILSKFKEIALRTGFTMIIKQLNANKNEVTVMGHE
ncbi:MAG: hypothetical protein CME70_23275 [Halobacteriovorax sp.]|nr:hypothetical protein [Halobacteriovorax sp.]|tara:strand:+ start:90329 stop:91342 length:1014 start_codon:yes stop_codon:yes gene_type:complete